MSVYGASLILWILYIDSSLGEEPQCLSKYDYDYKLMQKMFDLEQKLKQTTELVSEQKKFIETMSREDSGSVYTRWGRNLCDGDTSVVYTGYISGRHYKEKGGGSDTICLPSDPSWIKYKDGVDNGRGYVYGSEININDGHGIFEYPVNNQDLPCAVCKTQKRLVLMIPGRSSCYDGWTQEYQGYLMTEYHGHPSPYNHLCVDSTPDFIPNGAKNSDEHILYFTEARCGSLPCPPYVEGRELACVVCSM